MATTGRGWHALASFAEDAAAQAVGTVLGAGLAYVGASALGMLQHERPRTVLLVAVLAGGPLALGLLLRHWLAQHQWHGNPPTGMREMALRDLGQRLAAGEPPTAEDMRLLPLLMGPAPAGPARAGVPTRAEQTGS